MNQRLRDAFQALRDARDDATTKITYYTGEGRAGVWLPSRQEDIDSFSSTAAELRNKIDAWQALGIDEHTLKPCPHRDVELLDRAFDAISATEAILKDLEALHAGLLKFAQLLRDRFESMRPAARDYWTNAEPADTFEATEDWQQVLRQRRFDHVQSVLGMLPSHEHHSNADIWQRTGFAIAVSDGIEWNADSLPAGCFAWALDEIAGAEISEGANGFKWQNNTTDGLAIWFGTTDRTFREWANVKNFEWIKNTGRGRYSVNVTHPEVVAKRSKVEKEIRKRSGR